MVAPGDMFWTVSQGCKVARNECRFDCIPDFPGKENASVTRRRKPHLLAFAQTDPSFTITPVCSDSGGDFCHLSLACPIWVMVFPVPEWIYNMG